MSKRAPKRPPARKTSRPAVPPRRIAPPARARFGELLCVTNYVTGERASVEPISRVFYPTPRARDALCERLRLAIARLRERAHPAFPPYRDALVLGDGTLTLLMDELEGETLQTLLEAQGGPLPLPQAYSIARALLDALDALHGLDMVHRLVSPAMLVLGPDGHLTLLESGLADALLASLPPRRGDIEHTFSLDGYRAPEEIAHAVRDPRTDVFSAGAVLYEMVTGRPPPVLRPHLASRALGPEATIPPLGHWVPSLAGKRLESVVARALSPPLGDRFPTARAFLDALADAEPDVVTT